MMGRTQVLLPIFFFRKIVILILPQHFSTWDSFDMLVLDWKTGNIKKFETGLEQSVPYSAMKGNGKSISNIYVFIIDLIPIKHFSGDIQLIFDEQQNIHSTIKYRDCPKIGIV